MRGHRCKYPFTKFYVDSFKDFQIKERTTQTDIYWGYKINTSINLQARVMDSLHNMSANHALQMLKFFWNISNGFRVMDSLHNVSANHALQILKFYWNISNGF